MATLAYKIDPLLIAAIVSVESAGNRAATRYEKHYSYLYKPEKYSAKLCITAETERTMQKTSWGAMQIMGANARVLGFKGPLQNLSEEHVGIRYGVMFFNSLLETNKGNMKDAISSYNQGSPRKDKDGEYINKHYVGKVLHRYDELRKALN